MTMRELSTRENTANLSLPEAVALASVAAE
jgi:hypothetical protein